MGRTLLERAAIGLWSAATAAFFSTLATTDRLGLLVGIGLGLVFLLVGGALYTVFAVRELTALLSADRRCTPTADDTG